MAINKIPKIILASAILGEVIYQFFTPWYERLWRTIKRKFRSLGGKE